MRRVEACLVWAGLLLVALAMVLLVVHDNLAVCVELLNGKCQEAAFAYEGGGKLALLLGFVLLLLAALHGLLSSPDHRDR
ncbi:hypothetical protein [Pseudomonas turukhanskensis]|uniref:Uncharacterized protein n=1 Tax=Pseudomonas turukhanskensis TaxID=1806536 RepID=A0A9W6K930_9PSED|nr:hypothetical protein [Pseudomonas turukhanskensis]GLK91681.1 hypothetical protein GCM10017655_47450 [Pseudomonas turukhanskensis]